MEITATNENFKEIISGNQPVLVDFWATWCGPCRMLGPTVEAVAKEYDIKDFWNINVILDDCEDLSMQFGIRNIPTLLFFKGGQVVDKLVGNVPKAEITSKLDAIL